MRIRQSAIRVVVLGAVAAALASLVHSPEAAAQDAGAAVNGTSPTTERILSELRAGKPGAASSEDGPDGAAQGDAAANATADGAAPASSARTDGSLAEPAPASGITQDGLLRDQQAQQPVDGDLSADGKLAVAGGPAADRVDADGAAGVVDSPPTANARVVDGETDARTAAGRPRPVTEVETSPSRAPAAPMDDANIDDANIIDPPVAPPVIRPAVTDVDADPYGAVGVRRGGFLLLPAITADALVSDNVLQSSTNRQSDVALVLRPSLSVQSQWSRHALSFDLRGATTSYARIHAGDSDELHLNARGRLDITSRSSLEAETGYDFNTVPRSDPTVAAGAPSAPTTQTESLGLAYNQRFDRLSMRLHGTASQTAQSDSGSGGQSYRDKSLDQRVAYEFSPRLTLFGTAREFGRTYVNASGIDATGDDARVGVETDRSAKLSATASIGGARIVASGGNGAGSGGVVGDATATWLPSALTTVTLAASSNLDITNSAGAAALRTSQASLDVKHQLRRWLALMAGIADISHAYSGIGLSDVQHTGHIGVEYDFNREWALFGDVQRTEFSSSDPARSYTEDQVRFGVRLQR